MLCQRVENLVVGAPCGVMDQMTSGVVMKINYSLSAVNRGTSGDDLVTRRSSCMGADIGRTPFCCGGDYGSVRVGAFMGYRIVAELSGCRLSWLATQLLFLIRAGAAIWRTSRLWSLKRKVCRRLPESLLGEEFLAATEEQRTP